MLNYDFQTILTLIKQKDRKGPEVLYHRYGKPFLHFAMHRWNLQEDEAWAPVYKTLETIVLKVGNYAFNTQAEFDGFVFKVFVNFLKQQYRTSRQKQLSELQFVDFDKELELPGYIREELVNKALAEYYSDEMVDNPKLKALRSALDEIEPQDRDILLLRAQNYTYDEVAEFLQIENKQLKVRHHRAKKKLIALVQKKQI
jgi:RNA polymerase sigma factor (sigma-70 family)